jgi:hypothetical protein
MPVNFREDFSDHNVRSKCGLITKGRIKGTALWITGYLYAKDFPDVIERVKGEEAFGFSVDATECHITDKNYPVWEINRLIFTGGTLILRPKGAWTDTDFRLL